MRISNINPQYTSILSSYKKENNTKPSYNTNFTNYSDSVSFSSSQVQTRKPSKEFNRLVEDEDLKKEIINEIIIDPDGKYRKDIEENFEKCYQKIQEKQDENLDKNTLLKAMLFAFKTAKPKENYDIKSAEFKDLVLASYNAIERKDDLDELVENCKNAENEPDMDKINAILNFRSCYSLPNDISTEKMIVGRYLRQENNKIDTRDALLLGALFDEGQCNFFDETDDFFSLVKVQGKKSIDYNKFIFTYSALRQLNLIEEEEIAPEQLANYRHTFTMLKYDIIKSLIDNNVQDDGFLDVEKTTETFNDWLEYARNSKEYINNTITIPTLNPKTGDTDVKTLDKLEALGVNSVYFNNTIYRMMRLLT